jgi:hypothetical protein
MLEMRKGAFNKNLKKIEEGMVKKGGTNPKPSAPRPKEPPKGQSPKKQ